MQIKDYQTIFWDFDGVIKDSVAVKTEGYVNLFSDYGTEIQEKIREYHLNHSGISRYIKIPYYMKEFVGREIDKAETEKLCDKFSELTIQAVIESEWVPGVLDYLEGNYQNQRYFVVSGTPQGDLDLQVEKLKMKKYFKGVYGAPLSKREILEIIINEERIDPQKSLFIGDALVDYESSRSYGVDFVLRETEENKALFAEINCMRITDFKDKIAV